MAKYIIPLDIPGSFEPGECFCCPMSVDVGNGDYICNLHCRYDECPLVEVYKNKSITPTSNDSVEIPMVDNNSNHLTEDNWINVKDKLPEQKQSVLVCGLWQSIMYYGEEIPVRVIARYVDDKWQFPFVDIRRVRVTHWQPLPNYPKSKKET